MFRRQVSKGITDEAQVGTHSGPGFQRLVVYLLVALLSVMAFGLPAGAVEKKKKARVKASAVQKKAVQKKSVKAVISKKAKTSRRKIKKRTIKRPTSTHKSAKAPARRYHEFIDRDHNGIDDRAQRTVNKLGKPAPRSAKAKAATKVRSSRKATAKRASSAKKKTTKATIKKSSSDKKKSKAKKSRNYKKKKP